jgi:uncharacterized protein (DUF58 family)
LDEAAVERAVGCYRLALPRAALSGRLGQLRSHQAGSSLELHDFREYQPGDDPRHIDWNAVGRTGRLIVRVRQEEVAPRVEILVDASRSMGLTSRKAARTRELTSLLSRLARAQGLAAAVHWLASPPRRLGPGPVPEDFDAVAPLPEALSRVRLGSCGMRILVSDLLVEAPLRPALRRLSEQTALLALVQVLDPEDENPPGDLGARLIDSESGEALDRLLVESVLAGYRARLSAHQAILRDEARRLRATLATVSAGSDLESMLKDRMVGPLLEPRARS